MSEGFIVLWAVCSPSFPLQIRPSLIAACTIKNNDANRLRRAREWVTRKVTLQRKLTVCYVKRDLSI